MTKAVGDDCGKFKDIQTHKRAQAADLRRYRFAPR
jgi:hypothetical protein